jgi:hypothetical protein
MINTHDDGQAVKTGFYKTGNMIQIDSMKNQIFVVITVVLAITLGIQGYLMFQLNDRLNQLSGQNKQAGSSQLKIPKLPKLTIPKSDLDDGFFKDGQWDPYEKMQGMQNGMEQLFSDSFSHLHISIKTENAKDQTDEKMESLNIASVFWVNFNGY